jgi:hypothetical protein
MARKRHTAEETDPIVSEISAIMAGDPAPGKLVVLRGWLKGGG